VARGPVPTADQARLWRVLGRTIVVRHDGGYLAYKLARPDEAPEVLALEARHLVARRAAGAVSDLPEPVGLAGLVEPLPGWMAEAADIPPARPLVALVYRAATPAYWQYVNQAAAGQHRQGLRRATWDLFSWLRAGLVHGALTLKNHNLRAGRRFEWIVDCCYLPEDRRGVGRLDRLDEALAFPNVRASGLADLAELTSLRAMLDEARAAFDDNESLAEPIAHLGWAGAEAQPALQLVRVIGDYLLDLTLLAADGMINAGRLRRYSPSFAGDVAALADQLGELYALAWHAWSDEPLERALAWIARAVDLPRLARQLAWFLLPGNYAEQFDQSMTQGSEALVDELREQLYGPELELRVDVASHPQQWAGPALGFSLDGVHRDVGAYNGPWPFIELERAMVLVSLRLVCADVHGAVRAPVPVDVDDRGEGVGAGVDGR
jgi:hypothetical protein